MKATKVKRPAKVEAAAVASSPVAEVKSEVVSTPAIAPIEMSKLIYPKVGFNKSKTSKKNK